MAAATPYDIDGRPAGDGGGAARHRRRRRRRYRRIRDGFLDLQYRAQSMQLGDYEATHDVARPGRAGARRARRERHRRPARQVLERLVRPSPTRPRTWPPARRWSSRPASSPRSFKDLDSQLTTINSQATAEYASLTGADRRRQVDRPTRSPSSTVRSSSRSPTATSRTTCSTAATCCSTSSRRSHRCRSPTWATARSRSTSATRPRRSSTTATVTWPQTLTAPGGKLGALLSDLRDHRHSPAARSSPTAPT